MNPETIIAELRRINAWRRGDETIEQPEPKHFGELLDAAADELAKVTAERDSMAKSVGAEFAEGVALRARVAELEKKVIAQEEQLKALTNTKCGFGGYVDEILGENIRHEPRPTE